MHQFENDCATQHSKDSAVIVLTLKPGDKPGKRGDSPYSNTGCHLRDRRATQLTFAIAATTASILRWFSAATQMRPESTP